MVVPLNVAAPSVQNAPVAQPAQAALAVPALPNGITDNRMEEYTEYQRDLLDPDMDEFIHNVEAALALLEVVTDDKEDI